MFFEQQKDKEYKKKRKYCLQSAPFKQVLEENVVVSKSKINFISSSHLLERSPIIK